MRLVYLNAIRAILSVIVLLYHWSLVKLIDRIFPGLTGGAWGLAVSHQPLQRPSPIFLRPSRRRGGT